MEEAHPENLLYIVSHTRLAYGAARAWELADFDSGRLRSSPAVSLTGKI